MSRKSHIEPHQLIQDDDCHWYCIKVCDVHQFELWQVAMTECLPWVGHNFNDNRISGPGAIWFNTWEDRSA
jgi:hypothetical protein